MTSEYLDRLSRRIAFCWDKFDQTGDRRWMDAAMTADRMYLRARSLT